MGQFREENLRAMKFLETGGANCLRNWNSGLLLIDTFVFSSRYTVQIDFRASWWVWLRNGEVRGTWLNSLYALLFRLEAVFISRTVLVLTNTIRSSRQQWHHPAQLTWFSSILSMCLLERSLTEQLPYILQESIEVRHTNLMPSMWVDYALAGGGCSMLSWLVYTGGGTIWVSLSAIPLMIADSGG